MKNIIFLFLCFIPSLILAQERYLTVKSKDSVNGKPRHKSSLGANIKLNGYFDLFGGLNDNETFNVGLINVFGDDDDPSLNVDLYQTQIKFQTEYVLPSGDEILAVVEFDFWGGNGHLRLRKAYVETGHWQIGQNWNAFGDEDLWPNIMEWEGPPSGIWVRSPHIKYFNTFNNEAWSYEISLEAPITDYYSFEEFDPLVEEEDQVTPDLVYAIKNSQDWGHLRFSSIVRNIRYKLAGKSDSFIGYGLAFSGIYKNDRNNLQFEFVGGKGITAYMTSVAGLGYDGYPTINNDFEGTPAIGGWMAYEYYFTKNLHGNVVVGYTQYDLENVKREVHDESGNIPDIILTGDAFHKHYYGIGNLMYDMYERMQIGLELDYGVKYLDIDATVNNEYINEDLSRDAMRISFGIMFYF